MAKYKQAPPDIAADVRSLINQHYPDLQDAAIGLVLRDEAPQSNGRAQLGNTKRVGDVERQFLDYDFIIWIASDYYYGVLSEAQKIACLDHYLQYCLFDNDDGKAKLNKPDVVEFTAIIRRHGFWWPGGQDVRDVRDAVLQMPLLESEPAGRVEPVGPDVLDQLDDLDFA